MKEVNTTGSSLRDTINELTQQLIDELREETLTPMEKLALLKALLPYAMTKLPTAVLNYAYSSGQPTSARIIEPTPDGGKAAGKNSWSDIVNGL